MSVAEISTLRIMAQMTIEETLEGLVGGDKAFSRPNVGSQTTYNSGSDPPGVFASVQLLALVAGAATLDLTALAGGAQDTIDGTGKKLQALYICGAATGTNGKLTISEGAANPYELFGAANPIEYPAANVLAFLFQFGDTLDDVSAGDCEIDLAGVGTDVFTIAIVLG